METKYYIVARIDGDYAWLVRTDAEEEPLFIARALLPYAPALLPEGQAPAAPSWHPQDALGLVAPAKGSGATAMEEIDKGTKLKYEMLQYEIL